MTIDSNNIYLLHACRKQKNQTEKKDKKIVIKRAKELGKALGKVSYRWRDEYMPFVEVNIKKGIEKRKEESPSFAKAWDESREEYRLIGEMISLRKAEKITQSQLAAITGSKQQVISRIEKKESSPSLKIFCSMLNALGYELQIVKKSNTSSV